MWVLRLRSWVLRNSVADLYIAAGDLKNSVVNPKTAILCKVQPDITHVWNSMSESARCINLSAVCENEAPVGNIT
jgi:hypothetical protein